MGMDAVGFLQLLAILCTSPTVCTLDNVPAFKSTVYFRQEHVYRLTITQPHAEPKYMFFDAWASTNIIPKKEQKR